MFAAFMSKMFNERSRKRNRLYPFGAARGHARGVEFVVTGVFQRLIRRYWKLLLLSFITPCFAGTFVRSIFAGARRAR